MTLGNQVPGVRDDFNLAEDGIQARVRDTPEKDGMLNFTSRVGQPILLNSINIMKLELGVV